VFVGDLDGFIKAGTRWRKQSDEGGVRMGNTLLRTSQLGIGGPRHPQAR
jgi:hypothetical protein